MNYAIYSFTSVDTCPDHVKEKPYYSFFVPLAAYLWNRIGYKSIVFVVGDQQPNQFVLQTLKDQGAICCGVPSIKGYRDSTVAQVVRLFGGLITGLNEDDYCLTSDVDVLPFSKEYFHNIDTSKDLHIFSGDHYKDQKLNATRVPICFNGAKVKVWQEIMGTNVLSKALVECISQLNQYSDHWSAWFHDETYLVSKIKAWNGFPNRCSFMKRGTVEEDGDVMALNRVDRAHWKEYLQDPIDMHSIRPGHTEPNWGSLKLIFNRILEPNTAKWIEEYRNHYLNSI